MLYHLLFGQLHTVVPVLNVFRYITFRTASASVTALALSIVLGPFFIAGSLLSILRQRGYLHLDAEIPILVIMIGILLAMSVWGLLMPWGTALAARTRRAEVGFPVLTIVQIACATSTAASPNSPHKRLMRGSAYRGVGPRRRRSRATGR